MGFAPMPSCMGPQKVWRSHQQDPPANAGLLEAGGAPWPAQSGFSPARRRRSTRLRKTRMACKRTLFLEAPDQEALGREHHPDHRPGPDPGRESLHFAEGRCFTTLAVLLYLHTLPQGDQVVPQLVPAGRRTRRPPPPAPSPRRSRPKVRDSPPGTPPRPTPTRSARRSASSS